MEIQHGKYRTTMKYRICRCKIALFRHRLANQHDATDSFRPPFAAANGAQMAR
jgi:hypothetical protein